MFFPGANSPNTRWEWEYRQKWRARRRKKPKWRSIRATINTIKIVLHCIVLYRPESIYLISIFLSALSHSLSKLVQVNAFHGALPLSRPNTRTQKKKNRQTKGREIEWSIRMCCVSADGIVMGFQAYSIIEARTHVTLTQTAAAATTNDSLLIKVLVSVCKRHCLCVRVQETSLCHTGFVWMSDGTSFLRIVAAAAVVAGLHRCCYTVPAFNNNFHIFVPLSSSLPFVLSLFVSLLHSFENSICIR